jgi:hypothetical protein
MGTHRIGHALAGKEESSRYSLQSFRIDSRGLPLFATPEYEYRFGKSLAELMATTYSMDSNLQKYDIALDRLGASKSSKRQRPIVDRGRPAFGQQEAVSDAARALADLWNKGKARPNGGSR